MHATPHGESTVPGTGPGYEIARVGVAGISIDGPHGGIRNISKADEQFLTYNVVNPEALRDNIRQSALEIALLPDLLATLTVSPGACPGASPTAVSFNPKRLAVMGHSMGATIAPLVLAAEPRYGATVMSGAGSSFIENVLFKKSPTPVRPVLEAMLGFSERGLQIERGDPVLSLVQWAGEPADPPPYGRLARLRAAPPHALIVQGIVDTYILPTIASATHLSLGLELGGVALDATSPELSAFPTYASLLDITGGVVRPLPAKGNQDGVTAIVVQHPEDGIEDGHEAFFQQEGPKIQYRHFLETWAAGAAPVVPEPL